jgi:hypothetical protein
MITTKWDNHPDNTLLRVNDFVSKDATAIKPAQLGLVRFGRSTWLYMVKAGKAPAHAEKDGANTLWRLGDIRAWLAAQGDPTQALTDLDPENIRETLNPMDYLRGMVTAPNVEFVRFEKAGQKGAITMVIGHRVGKAIKEKAIWLAPQSG